MAFDKPGAAARAAGHNGDEPGNRSMTRHGMIQPPPTSINAKPVIATATKKARAAIQAAKFEGGRVLLPTRAAWLSDFEAELLAFPGGRHEDQVEAICQALAYEKPSIGRTTTKIIPV